MQQSDTTSQALENKPNNLPSAMSLAERLDPAIGEATSVMGAVVTELMRRSLRGGVMRIGDELTGYVSTQVDLVIADRTPALEELASTVADKTARVAATEVATEEVHALEERTTESNRHLSTEIEATRQAAEQSTAEAARSLTNHIETTGKHTLQAAEAKLAEEAQGLVRRIQEAEQRVQTTVRAEFSSQVQELMQRARERGDRLKSRFSAVENNLAELGKKHDAVHSRLAELVRANEVLTARVVELEKPRGLRALFAWLFGRRKKGSAPERAVEQAT
jgi:DNA repair exonuclease SbcCD ATPase subunit